MNESIELKVHIAQDEESGRWYIAQSDIPGLRLEADDALTLIRRVSEAAPELLELNEAEVLACHSSPAKPVAHGVVHKSRPAITPVFDSPLALAC